jgi:hypothetical protein
MNGWIKVHRELMQHWVWQDATYLKWWLILLLNVNHKATKFPVGTELFTCNPGQSFRSIQQWTDLFSCGKPTTLKFFNLLKNDGMIQTEIIGSGNRRKHLLTVVNWGKYQETETENFTETKPKTLPKQNPNIPPNKNEENEKNKKKEEYRSFAHLHISLNEVHKLKEAGYTQPQIDGILDAIQNYKGNTKYTSLFLTAKKWLLKEYPVSAKKVIQPPKGMMR